jgi:uncharacterized membrane protein YfcA
MNVLFALLIGAVGGVVAALCGVGGGVVMVPAFVYFLRMGQKAAVATSLAAIIFTALATSAKNQANGLIAWQVAVPAGVMGAIVGWFAADWLKNLSDVQLTRIFATLIIAVGIQMWVASLKKDNLSNVENPTGSSNHKKN